MGDGWEPLCNFLEVPLPKETNFPRTNDTDGFVDRCKARNKAQMMNVAFRCLVTGGKLAAIVLGASMTVRHLSGVNPTSLLL